MPKWDLYFTGKASQMPFLLSNSTLLITLILGDDTDDKQLLPKLQAGVSSSSFLVTQTTPSWPELPYLCSTSANKRAILVAQCAGSAAAAPALQTSHKHICDDSRVSSARGNACPTPPMLNQRSQPPVEVRTAQRGTEEGKRG